MNKVTEIGVELSVLNDKRRMFEIASETFPYGKKCLIKLKSKLSVYQRIRFTRKEQTGLWIAVA